MQLKRSTITYRETQRVTLEQLGLHSTDFVHKLLDLLYEKKNRHLKIVLIYLIFNTSG